jgi:hypothetical protein
MVKMTSAAMCRKLLRMDQGPPPPVRRQWTVCLDHRQAFGTGALVHAPVFPLYIKEGVGSFSLSSMHKVESAEELEKLLSTPTDLLPEKARPPEHGFYARWTQAGPAGRRKLAKAAFAREQARIARKERRTNEPLR